MKLIMLEKKDRNECVIGIEACELSRHLHDAGPQGQAVGLGCIAGGPIYLFTQKLGTPTFSPGVLSSYRSNKNILAESGTPTFTIGCEVDIYPIFYHILSFLPSSPNL